MTKLETLLYTLCVEGTAIAVCPIPVTAVEEEHERNVRDALFETWRFGGGDIMQLVGRRLEARPPTRKESKIWRATATATGKPYCVLGDDGEARAVQ